MTEINSKEFVVKVLLNTRGNVAHKDATQPQIATKPGANGQFGKFYQVQVMAKRNGPAPVEGKRTMFSIWDSGQRALIFEDIENALSNPDNYEKDSSGVRIKENILLFRGSLMAEKSRDDNGKPFMYYRVDSTGKTLINPRTKQPNISDTIQLFIFDFEAENGTAELLFSAENQRAYEHVVKSNKTATTGESSVQVEE